MTVRTRPVLGGKLPVGWKLKSEPGQLNGRAYTAQKIYLEQHRECFSHEAAHVILAAPDEYPPFRPHAYHQGKRTLMSDTTPGTKLGPHSLEAIGPVLRELVQTVQLIAAAPSP